MKNQLFKKVLPLLLIPLVYYAIFTGFSTNESGFENTLLPRVKINKLTPAPGGKNFESIIYNLQEPGWYNSQQTECYRPEFNMDRYAELKYTGIQNYVEYGSDRYGEWGETKSPDQIDNFLELMNSAGTNGFDGYYSLINTYMYGGRSQSIRYEAEGGNWGFSYGTRLGKIEPDQGRTVLHACPNNCPEQDPMGADTILKNITENFQHTDKAGGIDEGTWKIRPMIRIPINTPPDQEIIKIIVKNFNNSTQKEIVLRAMNFDVGGTYNGDYIDQFIFDQNIDSTLISGNSTNGLNAGRELSPYYWDWEDSCHVDFKVYWYGTTDVWIDHVTVNDLEGDRLMSGSKDFVITQEAEEFGSHSTTKSFYMDELHHSNIRSAEYIRNILAGYGIEMMIAFTQWTHVASMRDNTHMFSPIMDKVKAGNYDVNIHTVHEAFLPPVYGAAGPVSGPPFHPHWITTSSADYNRCLQDKVFGDRFSHSITNDENTFYNILEQNRMFTSTPYGSLVYQLVKARDSRDQYSPDSRIIFQPQMQGYMFVDANGYYTFPCQREPTNEELSAQMMMGIAHGIDGFCWFIYHSKYYEVGMPGVGEKRYGSSNLSSPLWDIPGYYYGLTTVNGCDKRTENLYGQDKWESVKELNTHISLLKNTLDHTNWVSAYSTHSEGSEHSFIHSILSIVPGVSGQNPCTNDNFTALFPDGPYLDCPEETYWEMGFYEPLDPETDPARYLVMVNRRCLPDEPGYTADNRVLRLRFNGDQLPGSTKSWTITEVGNSETPGITFNKNANTYVDLGSTAGSMGWFKPGEGKMFRIAPVTLTGGELVTDEVIEGNFVFTDTVISNGHDITVTGTTSTLSFSDSACIIMNGGTFTVDDASEMTGPNDKVTFKSSVTGHKWGGLKFNGTKLKIYNSKFEDIFSNSVNYAIKTVNCPLVDVRYNIFTSSSDTSGGVQAVYSDGDAFTGLYITYNTFTMNNSRGNGICVQGFSGLTLPVYIMNNTLTSNGYASGVMLSTITGGVIKNNTITGFATGINTLFSTADLYGNTITNTSAESKGIFTSSESSLGMMPSGTTWLGGYNVITNTSGSSINLQPDNSVFFTDYGRNKFDVTTSANPTAYHMYGSFWDGSYSYRQRNNCFKLDGTAITSPTMPYNYVVIGMNQVSLSFLSYDCSTTPPAEEDIVDIGNGLYDTIPSSGGMGSIDRLPLTKGEIERGSAAGISSESPSELYNAVRTAMRHRNYTSAKSKCYELINAYPDSTESIASLQTLFMSVIATDTGEVSSLKSFYEELILNHGSNTALVTTSNYLVQKCKVRMRQYSSALSGFEQIINANPTSYEGLLARWDYMATSLLVQGQGGGERNISDLGFGISDLEAEDEDNSILFNDPQSTIRNPQSEDDPQSKIRNPKSEDDPQSTIRNPQSADDKSPFTKEQRKVITNSVKNVLNTVKVKSDEEIKLLEESANNGDMGSKKELQKRSALKEVVKTQRPKDAIEHLKIVSSDIQKVFGSTVPLANNKGNENIPLVFRLSQNYPNPFNPVTKISYDIPRDAKVNIVVYDILGREVIRLVNNEIKTAGFYIAQFNAMNYASGVYFYRIEAEEPNGKKFVDSKKMVLLK